jgi:hypothetical protein
MLLGAAMAPSGSASAARPGRADPLLAAPSRGPSAPRRLACGSLPGALDVGDPVSVQAMLGRARAELTGTAATSTIGNELTLAGAALRLEAPGAPGLHQALAPPSGVDIIDLSSLGGAADQPLCLVRRAGSTWPTALVALSTGGAHCCSVVRSLAVEHGSWRSTDHNLGNVGGRLEVLSGQAAIVTADNAFAYRFADFAASGLPLLVLEVRGRQLVDVSRRHLSLVGQDASYWWSAAQADRPDPLGDLAAWTADECRLGRQEPSDRTLATLAAAGRLSPTGVAATAWPTGEAYVRSVEAFLAARGYCRRVG